VLNLAPPDDPIRPRALQVAEVQVTNMARLLDDLLDISRITRHKITLREQPLDLVEVIAGAVTAVGAAAEARRHRLVTRLSGRPLVVRGDRTRLEQVVVNLLTNAVRYTEPGGEIYLESERHEGSCGGEAVVRVRDSGIGIRPEMLQRIFEPFVQAEVPAGRVREGLGIGLALARTLVEMHGGSIQVESEGAGCGSTFTVRLPLHSERAAELLSNALTAGPSATSATSEEPSLAASPKRPEPLREPLREPGPRVSPPGAAAEPSECATALAEPVPQARAGEQPAVAGRRVLLVDDNKSITYMTAALLRGYGHEVVAVAHDGPSAIEAACEHDPEFILLDIGLPGMDGYAVAQRLRQLPQLCEVVLVAMTGYGQEDDRRRSHEAGFDAHVTKPASVQTLQDLFARHGRPRPLQQK
jgi:CheY-like chemotaxis protein